MDSMKNHRLLRRIAIDTSGADDRQCVLRIKRGTVTAGEYQLRQLGASARGPADQEYRAARRRLTLAVLWLACLVAWGVLSYATADVGAGPQTGASVQDEVRFDGRGKWTGY